MAHQAPDVYEQSSSNASSAAVNTNPTQGSVTLQQQQLQFAQEFWEEQITAAEDFDSDFKNHPLPLARIKKVMKSDPEVKVACSHVFTQLPGPTMCEINYRLLTHLFFFAVFNKR